jgi:hypothetical protein
VSAPHPARLARLGDAQRKAGDKGRRASDRKCSEAGAGAAAGAGAGVGEAAARAEEARCSSAVAMAAAPKGNNLRLPLSLHQVGVVVGTTCLLSWPCKLQLPWPLGYRAQISTTTGRWENLLFHKDFRWIRLAKRGASMEPDGLQ